MRLIGVMLLCLTIAACASKQNWQYSQMDTGSAEFSSSRLSYINRSHKDVYLEILRTKDACRGYLCTHHPAILSSQNNQKTTEVSIFIGKETHSFLAKKHDGGHKLLLPDELTSIILSNLEKNNEIIIDISGNQTSLSPQGFLSHYKKLQKNSIFFLKK